MSSRAASFFATGPDWHEARVSENAEAGRWFAAQWHLDQLIAVRPDDGALYADRGRVRLKMGRGDDAVADFDRALALGKETEWVLTERGAVHALQGQWKAAADDFARAAGLQAGDPMTRYYQALARLADDDPEGYRKACASAFERFGTGDDVAAVDRLGYACVAGPDALRVEGCVGSLCGGETWTRSTR